MQIPAGGAYTKIGCRLLSLCTPPHEQHHLVVDPCRLSVAGKAVIAPEIFH